MTLTQLHQSNPLRYNTDKGDVEHSFSGKSYLDRYAEHFQEMKDWNGDVLEIGVSFGGSIRLWRDFFNKGTIAGMDIRDLSAFQETDERVKIFKGDQSKFEDLDQLSSMEFKLVIDDGSHKAEDILFSFDYLWPKVIPNGWYVMEDLRLPIDWGTHWMLEGRFRSIQLNIDRMVGDVQTLIHYPMVTMIQKA